MEKFNPVAALVGCVLISVIFLSSGYNKIVGFAATQKYMESHGLLFAEVLLCLAIFAELSGSISLILGAYTRLGALALLLFMIPTTLIFHTDFSQANSSYPFSEESGDHGGHSCVLGHGGWRSGLRFLAEEGLSMRPHIS